MNTSRIITAILLVSASVSYAATKIETGVSGFTISWDPELTDKKTGIAKLPTIVTKSGVETTIENIMQASPSTSSRNTDFSVGASSNVEPQSYEGIWLLITTTTENHKISFTGLLVLAQRTNSKVKSSPIIKSRTPISGTIKSGETIPINAITPTSTSARLFLKLTEV